MSGSSAEPAPRGRAPRTWVFAAALFRAPAFFFAAVFFFTAAFFFPPAFLRAAIASLLPVARYIFRLRSSTSERRFTT